MRGGALPVALLCAALDFALAFAPRKTATPALLAFVVVAGVLSWSVIDPRWTDAVFLGCWISIAAASLAVHLPQGVSPRTALLLAVAAGVAAGSVTAVAAERSDLLIASPVLLACVPAGWLVRTGRPLVVKVAASWLLAVAMLAAALPATVATPGYAPDHME